LVNMYRLIYSEIDGKKTRVVEGDWVERKQIFEEVAEAEKSADKRILKVEHIIDVTSSFYRE
jgi:hypothetical protein